MKRTTWTLAALGVLLLTLPGSRSFSQTKPFPQTKITPKLEPIAETKLLMEGLAHANFRGLERLLQNKPNDAQSWIFARGQALLIAETANLLMLRPPKTQGQPIWFERSMELRSKAQDLAVTIARRDHDGSKRELGNLANVCNRCHQNFKVQIQIEAFADPDPPRKVHLEKPTPFGPEPPATALIRTMSP